MSRVSRRASNLKSAGRGRGRLAKVGWLGVLPICLITASAFGAPVDRIAVAPFAPAVPATRAAHSRAGQDRVSFVANELVARLALRPVDRLIAPADFVAEAVFEPRAEDIRKWAYNASVDAVVVGRVALKKKADGVVVRRIEIVVRSGHSGAEIAHHEVAVPGRAELAPAIEDLAAAIWADLGHAATAVPPAVEPDRVESSDSKAAAADARGRSAGHGLDAQLAFASFQSQAPIEIKADEAEIIARDEGRELIFKRNVRVRQDTVTLLSDRLEASYRKGESEPRRLVAQGRVKIEQGDRRAACDHAIYIREESRLTCSGRAELIQGCDIVRGESIVFDLAADQARVEGAASIVIRPRDDAGSPCETRMGSL